GRAFQPPLELARAVAAEDQMGMAVHQPLRDPAPAQTVDFRSLVHRQIGARPDPRDAPILDQDRGLLDRAIGLAALGHGRDVTVGDQQIGVDHRAATPARISQNQRPAVREPRSPTSSQGSYSVRSTARTLACAPMARAASKKSCTDTPPGRAPGLAGHWLRSITSMSKST